MKLSIIFSITLCAKKYTTHEEYRLEVIEILNNYIIVLLYSFIHLNMFKHSAINRSSVFNRMSIRVDFFKSNFSDNFRGHARI